jgi:hypothetical protein
MQYLSRQNQLDVVLCLCVDGPKYKLKANTGGLYKLNEKTHYDNEFAGLVLSLILKHRAKSKSVFFDVARHWVAQGSPCVLLQGRLLRDSRTQSDLIDDVLANDAVKRLRATLLDRATEKGEWEVISHDATYQVLFGIIGQEKMSQKPDEAHALHSFLGKTGAMPGGSVQHTESGNCFCAAAVEVLPSSARATTKMIFSDSPPSIEGDYESVFPKAVGIGEDGMHFPFRVEECFGEHRVPLSSDLVKIQSKFRVPASGAIYHGQQRVHGPAGTWSPDSIKKRSAMYANRDWDTYCQQPYKRHQQYIDDVAALTWKYPEEMSRKNKKGRSVAQILESGTSYIHFGYLQNCSVLLNLLSARDREHLSWATTGNEAVHWHNTKTESHPR